MNITKTAIDGLLVIEPKIFSDSRGYFFETYQKERYKSYGIDVDFVQDNVSFSCRGILRGLHLQRHTPQGKLVQVLQGEVFDVAVDVRPNSKTFGDWVGIFLSEVNKKQFWIPAGFAHGFLVTSEYALFSYKCTDYYAPQNEVSLRWDDPDLGIAWPTLADPILSEKDKKGYSFKEYCKC
jgi:dTDP-4-dehydrorhamnose 3,5-epimerase